jgi:hypothetical protein
MLWLKEDRGDQRVEKCHDGLLIRISSPKIFPGSHEPCIFPNAPGAYTSVNHLKHLVGVGNIGQDRQRVYGEAATF